MSGAFMIYCDCVYMDPPASCRQLSFFQSKCIRMVAYIMLCCVAVLFDCASLERNGKPQPPKANSRWVRAKLHLQIKVLSDRDVPSRPRFLHGPTTESNQKRKRVKVGWPCCVLYLSCLAFLRVLILDYWCWNLQVVR